MVLFQSKKDLDEESSHLYKVFIPQKSYFYPPPPDAVDIENNNIEHNNKENSSDLLNIDFNRQRCNAHDVIRRDLSNDGSNDKLYPLPPKKRWIPRGFKVNNNGATVWVTDVTCDAMTVTILESEDGYFDSKCVC